MKTTMDRGISIHALREEGDRPQTSAAAQTVLISIHALREEGDTPKSIGSGRPSRFLSTPSARRATSVGVARCSCRIAISIHALREEGDAVISPLFTRSGQFLSTPSARRATEARGLPFPTSRISIHALREEGDVMALLWAFQKLYFYPRPPRGGRRQNLGRGLYHFQGISIHALREEGDVCRVSDMMHYRFYFYPRPPRGGRQQKQRQNLYFQTNYTTFCTNLEEP